MSLSVSLSLWNVVLKVSPDQRVFRGETVTLTCDIQRAGNIQWTYSWFRDASVIRDVTERVYSITSDESYSEYSCRGERSDSQRSHISAAVTLTVSERPEPVVKVSPDQRVFRGETVTLTCDIQTWTYSWFRDASVIRDVTERVYSITSDESYSEYSCRGERSDSQKSHTSAAVTLTVSGEYQPKVTIKPQSSVFTGDTVTLSCDVGQLTGQTVIWFKDFTRIQTGDETKTLRDVRVSDGGKYSCTVGGKTTQSQIVMLTVRGKPKPALRTVTLTCDMQETNVSSWSYSWNKDDSVIHVSQSQEYRISSVNESHTGHYSCAGNETQGSRYSHTSDKVTLTVSGESLYILVSGLSGAFLLIFLLVLQFCCKRNKGSSHLFKST
uniref:Ig-like domain-containing protein n=1 Tax=Sinocyclocheilus grahami TaxID=75366 RepID=A0A672LM70_SINGR